MDLKSALKSQLATLGFSVAGVTAMHPPAHYAAYLDWVANGRHASMGYLATEQALARRANARVLLTEAASIIVVALPYANTADAPEPAGDGPRGRVAAYARGVDYHDLIPPRLEQAAAFLSNALGVPVARRAYTDTGPILERDYAQAAGLGWIGKNTCLIIPGSGSFFLLGELIISAELEPDPPFIADRCGTCQRCIEACPSGCIRSDRTLDARKCISYLTIENKGEIPVGLRAMTGEWVFGCDICQQVCPWNRRAKPPSPDKALCSRSDLAQPNLIEDLALSQEEFSTRFRGSPLKRAKRRGYLRNVAVALGNAGQPAAVPALARCLAQEPEALVRAHAAWSLGRLNTLAARTALEQAAISETDAQTLAEIRAALG